MVPWTLIKGFLFSKWKLILYSGIAISFLFVGFKIYGAFKDRDALLEERKGVIAQLVKDNTEAEIAKQSAEQTIARMIADVDRIEKIYRNTLVIHKLIRVNAEEQKKVFEEHDFTRLSNAKPGLIIAPMNKATQERFDEISDTFNN